MIPKIGFPNNPPENEIAAIYARVSTEEQTRGYSLSTQIDANTQYAASRGYRTIATIQDGYTGESLDRPGIDELRDLVKRQHVDVLIVYDVDRWARKSVFQMILEEEFSGYGVRIEYVNGQYADTDEGRLQKQLKGAISEYEKAKILERLKRGKRGKAKSGFVNVGARTPYGYDVKTEPHKQWLVVNDEEKKIVQLIFKLYTEGDVTISRATRGKKEDQRWSLREIAVHLMVKAVKGGIVSMGRIFRPSENERASSQESEHSLSVTHRASNGYGCAQFLAAWLSRRVLAG